MKRMWIWLAVGVSVTVLAAGLTAQEDIAPPDEAPPANVSLRAVGLSVTMADEDDDFTDYGQAEGLAEDIVPGTAVYFLVELDEDALLEVLPGESTVEVFTDSTGKLLLAPGPADRQGANGLRGFDESSDRSAFRFMIASELLPAEGAISLHIKGVLAMTVRGEAKTASVEVTLIEDETFELPDREVTVSDAEVDGDNTDVSFSSEMSFETLGAIRFSDADGNEIEAEDYGVSWSRYGDEMSYGQTFELSGVHEAVTIEVDYFEPVPVSVPIDVTVGLGR